MTDRERLERMAELARHIEKIVSEGRGHKVGFVLLVFDFVGDERIMNYMSNAERADMIGVIRELLANMEGRAVSYSGRA